MAGNGIDDGMLADVSDIVHMNLFFIPERYPGRKEYDRRFLKTIVT